jgi:Flp pilus assembly protein TadD
MPGRQPIPTALLAVTLLACLPSAHVHARATEEIARGYAYLARGDLERADVAFAHALEFNEDTPEALNGAGIVARRMGRDGDARHRFQHAVRVAPDFAEAYVNLGELDLAEGRDDAAEEDFRAALRIDPDLVVARLDLARTLLHRGRRDLAHREERWAAARREYLHLLEALEVAEAHHDLAFMDYEEQRWDEAADEYRRAAALAPRYVEALHGWCIASARAGRCDEAEAACRRCLEVAPGEERCEVSARGAAACGGGPVNEIPRPGVRKTAGPGSARSEPGPARGSFSSAG